MSARSLCSFTGSTTSSVGCFVRKSVLRLLFQVGWLAAGILSGDEEVAVRAGLAGCGDTVDC